jgi:anti-sigma regulatory factor (Ser/Thr protein kinase)
VDGVLGPIAPVRDVAVLLANRELFGNSVQHSGSGDLGETVTIAVKAGDGLVWVEVTDSSGPEYRGIRAIPVRGTLGAG